MGAPSPEFPSPKRMLDFRSGGWVLLLALLITLVMVVGRVIMLAPTFDKARALGDGVHAESYGFDLSNCIVSRKTLVAASADLPRDGMPTLDEPQTIAAASLAENAVLGGVRKLTGLDRVVGVRVNGHARAYPLWILAWHEICNDTLGGAPIAVTYSPLCDSVVVFDRRVDGETLEFGYSGLLHNSNLVMYDRSRESIASQPAGPSLWSQLLFKAISGPAVERGAELTVMHADVTIWEQWRRAHPETEVILPVPSRKRVYKRDAYAHYYATGELRFPVEPTPPVNGLPWMSPVIAVRENGAWRLLRGEPDLPADSGEAPRVYALWFAWHAHHPDTPAP